MRYLLWSAIAALAIQADVCWAQDSGAAPNAQAHASAAGKDTGTAKPAEGERWRFRWHQGLWWYWLPSDSWVYWTDNRWVPYDAESYAQFNAARSPQTRSYSSGNAQGGYSSGGGQQGNWGPVRYNQWGQPQWPYSQRTSGLKQLGPVPALGGVRSLPGWGGER